MSWKEKMAEWGGGDFTFLSTDGETIIFIVVDEPTLLKSKYKGKDQDRIACPLVTDDGFQLLVCGKRLARKLSKHEGLFNDHAFMATRHGAEGDVNSTYELTVLSDKDTFPRLNTLRKTVMEKDTIKDAIDAVMEVMDN